MKIEMTVGDNGYRLELEPGVTVGEIWLTISSRTTPDEGCANIHLTPEEVTRLQRALDILK